MSAPASGDTGAASRRGDQPPYSERLWVPVWWWLVVAGMAGSLWFAVWYATPGNVGHVVGAAASALCAVGLLLYGRLAVRVDRSALRVGTATLPLSAVGSVLALSDAQAKALRGTAADATARLFLRPYVARGVRVEVTDPDDPTPYWYVATRHPEALAAALSNARTDSPA